MHLGFACNFCFYSINNICRHQPTTTNGKDTTLYWTSISHICSKKRAWHESLKCLQNIDNELQYVIRAVGKYQ